MALQETKIEAKSTLTWTTFFPCGIRGIPTVEQHPFSIWTHLANHADPPLLHKNPMSDLQQLASETKAVLALGSRGQASSPPLTAVL